MSSRLSAEIALVRSPEKLPDRLLLSGVIGNTSGTSLSDQFVIAYLFEITRPWLPSSQVLPAMAAVLTEQQATLSPKDNLDDQFEGILRAVNQKLNEVSEGGETDWIGNLNGLILLLGKEELHFSQTGRCPTYLLQNNRIRQITDDQNEKDPHPLKTFSNLASGHLQPGDRILIANMELYSEISLDALRRILNNSTPYTACQSIAKELKKEKNGKVSTLIAAFNPFDEKAVASTEPTVVDMEEELQSNAKKIYRRLTPFLQATKESSHQLGQASTKMAQQIGAASLKAAQSAQQATKEKVIPGASALLTKGAEKIKGGNKNVRPVIETIYPHDDTVKAELVGTETPIPTDQAIGSVIPASELALEGSPNQPTDFKGKMLAFLLHTIPAALKKGGMSFGEWMQVPRNKKIAALVVAVILVAAVILGAVSEHRHPTVVATLNQNTATLTTIRSNETKIATAISANQIDQASSLISDSLTKLTSISNPTNDQKQQASALWTTISTQADSLTKTTRLASTQATYNFPGSPQNFFASLPYFYGFQSQASALARTGSGTLSNIQASINLPDTNDAIVSAAPSSETDTNGYILTKQSKVYRIVQSGSTTNILPIQPVSGTFATGTNIATYSGNVYILDSTAGLLWRYLNNGTSYSQGTMIIDVNKLNLKGSLSISIDGSIYVLQADGSVIKINGGKPDPTFTLNGQPTLSQKLIRPLQIITSPDYPNIYVLDGGNTSSPYSSAKVLVFSKNGTFISQYAFPQSFTNVSAFDISPKDHKIWVLNGATVSEFAI